MTNGYVICEIGKCQGKYSFGFPFGDPQKEDFTLHDFIYKKIDFEVVADFC